MQTNTADPPWRLTPGDVAIAVAAAAVEIRDLLMRGSTTWFVAVPRWIDAVVWALMSCLLLLRRRHPVTVAVVSVGADMVSFFPAAEAVAMFTVGAHVQSSRKRILLLLTALLSHTVATGIGHGVSATRLAAHWVTVALAPLLLGLYLATRQRLVLSLRERAQRIERQKVLAEENARLGERRRIALEMHDVVAHGVTQMVVRAGTLQVLAESRGEGWVAREAAALHATGRTVLDELRTALGVLRVQGAEPEGPSRSPLPGIADLPLLLENARQNGTRVEYDQSGDLSLINPHHARAVYRVVQESLTNVAKHAPLARTRIDLDCRPGLLTVRVHNTAAPTPPTAMPAGGHGLTGMRERVETLGGSLRAGPLPDGGFLVEARLPLPQAEPPATLVEPAP